MGNEEKLTLLEEYKVGNVMMEEVGGDTVWFLFLKVYSGSSE